MRTVSQKPTKNRYDLVVIGSGPGGQRAAIQAAKLSKSVLLLERAAKGGFCLHRATIPSKTLREAAIRVAHLNVPSNDEATILKMVMERKSIVIGAECDVIAHQLSRNGVEFVGATGSFLGPHKIAVENDSECLTVQTDFIVLATGSSPQHPDDIDFNGTTIFDSDSILNLSRLPKSIAVVGAGVIGCEYASIFSALGSKVTLVNRPNGMLKSVDYELVEALRRHFQDRKVEVLLGADFGEIQPFTRSGGDEAACMRINGEKREFDAILYCVGRTGNVTKLNLEKAGIQADSRGTIVVNQHYQTNVPHIYAVGDLVGFPSLASASAEQGRLASAHAFGFSAGVMPESFPYGVYTIPEISWAGKGEEDLIKANIPHVVGRAMYREIARGKILGDEHGFLKLLIHKESRRILGIHAIGTGATELIHIGQVAMDLNGTVDFLVQNVFNYPTLAEAYKVAAYHAFNQLNHLPVSHFGSKKAAS